MTWCCWPTSSTRSWRPKAAEIIRRAAAALAPGGRVVVVDFAIDDAKQEHLLGALFAINMRSFGDTYSEPELRGWMEDAGLDRH